MNRALMIGFALLSLTPAEASERIPPEVAELLTKHCADCHSGGAAEGGFEIELEAVEWRNGENIQAWEHVHEMVSRNIMPPPEADSPSASQRKLILDWIHRQLMQHSPIGGTPLRRLNRREYANTIDQVFNLGGYEVPTSFPADNEANGFDNQGDALVLAGSHLEAFAEAANDVADQLFPPPAKLRDATTAEMMPQDLVVSYSSACVVDGAMRLASSGGNVVRHGTWPNSFEAKSSGVFQLEIDVSTFNPPADETPRLTIATMAANGSRRDVQVAGEFEVNSATPQTISTEVRLNKGDTVVLRYMNGPFDYDNVDMYQTFLTSELTRQPRLAAAWDKIGKPARGGSGWLRVKEAMAASDLDVAPFIDNPDAIEKLVRKFTSNKVGSGETLVYKYFEEGPNIGIHRMQLHGPTELIRDRSEIRSQKLREQFVGADFEANDPEALKLFLGRFLTDVFRRPATAGEVAGYEELVRNEAAAQDSTTAGLHLAVRTALLSPAFLYRGIGEGTMNDFELASRLSYFLKSSPPDDRLNGTAEGGRLTNSSVLAKETRRLMNRQFAADFTRQWLDLDTVAALMPDERLGKFSDRHRRTIIAEATETFWHIWSNNLPVTEFIAPDFLFTDSEVGRDIYELDQFRSKKAKKISKSQRNKMVRLDIPRDGRHGGLLGMSAVMMATANGVDTQPVLRGVWVQDNILGTPPPEPPDAVPALTPDTSSATTVKQRLAAHMNETSCAVCHREIDPLGFVLENFDPVGRWRTNYPVFRKEDGKTVNDDGNIVESDGTLPDGTKLESVVDLKRWLVKNPELFARCLSEKLLTYATGRKMNYRERQLIAGIVNDQRSSGLKLQDLLQALVDSEVFRTR